jgi:hypothetical protein
VISVNDVHDSNARRIAQELGSAAKLISLNNNDDDDDDDARTTIQLLLRATTIIVFDETDAMLCGALLRQQQQQQQQRRIFDVRPTMQLDETCAVNVRAIRNANVVYRHVLPHTDFAALLDNSDDL